MKNSKNISELIVPVVSVIVALLVGSIILLLSGISPFALFQAISDATIGGFLSAGSIIGLNGWFQISAMLVFTGLAVGFSYKGGMFNIGAEGQFIIASLVTSVFAINSNLPNQLIPIVGLVVGFIAGALWAFLPGLLKATYGISEVVITIMLNWIGMYIYDFLVQGYFHQASNIQQTPIIAPSKLLLVNGFNYAIIIAIIIAIVYWFILNKTTFGFEIKAIGNSKDIAKYTGINAKRRTIETMMISGGFAGLAGATYALSYGFMSTIAGNFTNYGFDGIAVALLGSLNSIGIVISALLMGALRNAQAAFGIQRIPSEISDIIIALIILFTVIGPILYKKRTKRGV